MSLAPGESGGEQGPEGAGGGGAEIGCCCFLLQEQENQLSCAEAAVSEGD